MFGTYHNFLLIICFRSIECIQKTFAKYFFYSWFQYTIYWKYCLILYRLHSQSRQLTKSMSYVSCRPTHCRQVMWSASTPHHLLKEMITKSKTCFDWNLEKYRDWRLHDIINSGKDLDNNLLFFSIVANKSETFASNSLAVHCIWKALPITTLNSSQQNQTVQLF